MPPFTGGKDSGINIGEFSSEWSGGGGVEGEGDGGSSKELEALVRHEQQAAVNESLDKLQAGLNDAKVQLLEFLIHCSFSLIDIVNAERERERERGERERERER